MEAVVGLAGGLGGALLRCGGVLVVVVPAGEEGLPVDLHGLLMGELRQLTRPGDNGEDVGHRELVSLEARHLRKGAPACLGVYRAAMGDAVAVAALYATALADETARVC